MIKTEQKKLATRPVELCEEKLEQVTGGLLLPAVQKVREAAARIQC